MKLRVRLLRWGAFASLSAYASAYYNVGAFWRLLPASSDSYTAYVTSEYDNTVSMFSINPTTGLWNALSSPTVVTGTRPRKIAIDPFNRFAYVPNYDFTVSMYTIHPTTGALISTGPASTNVGRYPSGVAVHPSGKFAYIPGYDSVVSMYSINQTTGTLDSLSPASVSSGGVWPFNIALDPAGKFAYATNAYDNTVAMFTVNQTTGILTANSPQLVAAGAWPSEVVTDPAGRFAYVTNSTTTSVSMYKIDPNSGLLTPTVPPELVYGPPHTGGGYDSTRAITLDPTGRFAYLVAGNYGDGAVSMYSINPHTGVLTPLSPATIGSVDVPYGMTADPSGKFLYVGSAATADVSMYSINQTTGLLSAVAPGTVQLSGSPHTMISIGGKPAPFGIVEATPGDTTVALKWTLSRSATSYTVKYGTTSGNYSTTVSTNATSPLTVTGLTNGVTYYFMVTATNSKGSQNAFEEVSAMPVGDFAYLFEGSGTQVGAYMYHLNPTTGVLTSTSPATLPVSWPIGITMDSTRQHAYIVNYDTVASTSAVAMYSINQTTGFLNATSPATVPVAISDAGANTPLVIHPNGKFAYVAGGYYDGIVSMYTVNQTTGVLSPTSPATLPTHVNYAWETKIHPSGKFAYVVGGYYDGTVAMYTVDQTTGVLTATSPSTLAIPNSSDDFAEPHEIAIDASGRFAYVTSGWYGGGTISMYSINQTTGVLSSLSPATLATSTESTPLVMHPDGKFAYQVSSYYDGVVSIYSINSTTGVLTANGTETIAAFDNSNNYETTIGRLQLDPYGRFAYVPNYVNEVISMYTVNPYTGALSPTTPATVGFPTGSQPVAALTTDPYGKFLYATSQSSSTKGVWMYSINQATGVLTPTSPATVPVARPRGLITH